MLRKLCLILLCCAWASSARAQPQSQELRAIIAAPAEIQLANTEAFTILFSLARLKDEVELPPKLWLLSSYGTLTVTQFSEGKWQTKTGPSPLEIDRPNTVQTVMVTLDENLGYQPTIYLEVTTAGVGRQLLGSAEIQLKHPAKIQFTDVPSVVRADGKSVESITVRVMGEQDEPIPNVPLIIHGDGPASDGGLYTDIIIAATTDKQGYATFVLPTSVRPGIALLQMDAGGTAWSLGANSQLEIHYQTDINDKENWLIENPNWWKEPILLGK